MRHESFCTDDVVKYLIGSCRTLEGALDATHPGMTEDDLLPEDREAICSEIHECECCNWWVESHEVDESGNCEDCSDNDDPAYLGDRF